MVVTCEIQFDHNPSGTYFAGQLVSGSVMLKSDKSKDVKGILLKVSGYAATKWTERHFGRRRLFFGREEYLSSLTYLLGSDSNNRSTIQSGIHTYTFACQLPYNCPSSYEGYHGSIRYVVKVVLVRPWKFDQIYTRGFTVLKTMDLNFESPEIRLPANSEAYKTFCCGPCKTEPLKMNLHLPQAGFVPGQSIPVTAVVANNTNRQVSSLEFWLVMHVRYHSQRPKHTITERIVVSKAKGESVLRNCTRAITANLVVPATPPTCHNLCSIIQIVYQIEVEAKINSLRGSQTVIMPVTIGNVPLQVPGIIMQQPSSSRGMSDVRVLETTNVAESVNEKTMNGGVELQEQTITTISTVAPLPVTLPADMPPPSYEESVHTLRCDINAEELHTFGPNEFAPLYPVFNIESPPPVIPAQNGTNDSGYDNKTYES